MNKAQVRYRRSIDRKSYRAAAPSWGPPQEPDAPSASEITHVQHASEPRAGRAPRPQVGISSVWYEGNPCNMHLLKLAEEVKRGVEEAGLVGFRCARRRARSPAPALQPWRSCSGPPSQEGAAAAP
jgi:dihydroxyacid dehydratase/phosphogluconate dehydratase